MANATGASVRKLFREEGYNLIYLRRINGTNKYRFTIEPRGKAKPKSGEISFRNGQVPTDQQNRAALVYNAVFGSPVTYTLAFNAFKNAGIDLLNFETSEIPGAFDFVVRDNPNVTGTIVFKNRRISSNTEQRTALIHRAVNRAPRITQG